MSLVERALRRILDNAPANGADEKAIKKRLNPPRKPTKTPVKASVNEPEKKEQNDGNDTETA